MASFAPRRPTRPLSAAAAPAAARRSIFSYSIAASYIAKDRPYDPNTHIFHFNPYNRLQTSQAVQRRKPAQRPESGQDAFFVSRIGNSSSVALGVADGVGGWMDSGVDPADFSHGLCEYMAAAAYEHGKSPAQDPQQPPPPLGARHLMEVGYQAVRRDPGIPAGGSTAVVGLLSPDGELEVANLGDSGFIQLRLNGVHTYSEPQTHAFNTPYQLSVVPDSILKRMAAFGGGQLCDEPRDAEVTRHSLRHGDVLVFASDGVWDNLFNQDILRLVSRAMRVTGAWQTSQKDAGVGVADPQGLRELTHPNESDVLGEGEVNFTLQSLLATQIAGAAKTASVNRKLNGPFAKEVKRYYPREPWQGGKVDDICVIVVVVSEEPGELEFKSKL